MKPSKVNTKIYLRVLPETKSRIWDPNEWAELLLEPSWTQYFGNSGHFETLLLVSSFAR